MSNFNVKSLKGNFQHIFNKSLNDLIRGLRNNKENETKYIAQCMDEIRQELRNDNSAVKANAIAKLGYLEMFGYDISWAAFNIVEVMASTKFTEKRVAYWCASQSFNEHTDVLMLTTNLIRKDVTSSGLYEAGVALNGLACFVSTDLSRDLANDVVTLLSSSRPYIRKKAVLLLYKIFLKYPDALRPTFPRLKEKLDDTDPGVQSAAVNVICELARKNPKNYLTLAPTFFKLMTTSTNNWMLIKIIKLFGALVPLEPRLGKKLLEPLTNLINNTNAMSLLYECINTVIAVLISISAGGEHMNAIQLCVGKLGMLIDDSDQNLKYLGLLAMGRILQTHPKAVQSHKDVVLACLDDKDESIRLRALDLLYGMVGKKNIMEIIKRLMEHVELAEGANYRDELLARIINICSHNNYQYITDFEWYVSVLVELAKVEGTAHGVMIAAQMLDVAVRVQSIRHLAVQQMALLVQNANLLLRGSQQHRSNVSEVLTAASFICGEYAEHLEDAHETLEAMIKTKPSSMPGHIQASYIQNMTKLYARLIKEAEQESDWNTIHSLDNMLESKLPLFESTDHLEAQERACSLRQLVKYVIELHDREETIGDDITFLFEGELNPVAPKAQRKVPLPAGLDLDAWINEPPAESEQQSENDSEQEASSKTSPSRRSKAEFLIESKEETYKSPSPKELERAKAARQAEIENNPYYVKSKTPLTPPEKPSPNVKNRVVAETKNEPASLADVKGVRGLVDYEKSREATLNWKTKDGKTKTRRKKRNADVDERAHMSELIIASEEMPDDAASTDDESHNPFMMHNGVSKSDRDAIAKALDIDLDEPLKDTEALPIRQHRQPSTAMSAKLGSNTLRKETSKSKKERSKDEHNRKKKEKKQKKHKEQKLPNGDVLSSKKATDAAENANVDDIDYWLGKKDMKNENNTEAQQEKTEKKKKKKERPKSISEEKKTQSALLDIAEHASTPNKSDYENAPSGLSTPAEKVLTPIKGLRPLVANDDLHVTYTTACPPISNGTLTVTVHLLNPGIRAANVKHMTWTTLDTLGSKLQMNGIVLSDDGIPLPGNLSIGQSSSIDLVYQIATTNMPIRMRGTLSYQRESEKGTVPDKLDFSLHLNCVSFCHPSTISLESYNDLLSMGELTAHCRFEKRPPHQETLQAKAFSRTLERLFVHAHAVVIDQCDRSANLYCQTIDGMSVAVVIQLMNNGDIGIDMKTSDETLLNNLKKEYEEIISGHWEVI